MGLSKPKVPPPRHFLPNQKKVAKHFKGAKNSSLDSVLFFSHQSFSLSFFLLLLLLEISFFFFFFCFSSWENQRDRQTHQWKTHRKFWKVLRTQAWYHLRTATAPTVAAAVAATAMDSTSRQRRNPLPDRNRILIRQRSFKPTPRPSSRWSKC